MRPLHDNLRPSSPLTPSMLNEETLIHRRARPSPRRRRVRSSSDGMRSYSHQNICLLFVGLSLSSLHRISNAQQHEQQNQNQRGLTPSIRSQRVLGTGGTECAGCNTATLVCSGTTVMDEHCGPCATGQTWWPCNVQDECYCKDLTAVAAAAGDGDGGASGASAKCELPPCLPSESGRKVVPFTNCEKYVTCNAGVPGPVESCAPGQAYSPSIMACNIISLVTCDPDPSCPPTANPTATPTESMSPTSALPTRSMPPSISPTRSIGNGNGSEGGGSGGSGDANGASSFGASRSSIHPSVLEGMYVMDAHMAANKIMLTRELLTSPGGGGGGARRGQAAGLSNDFSFIGFRSSLHTMVTNPVANQTFFIGQHYEGENAKAYGLVNIAAFLAMSVEDSIVHGSCDEVNTDLVGGMLPISNACGQNGMSYQDMTCPRGEEMYNCEVDTSMRAQGNPIVPSGRQRNSGGEGDTPPVPLYCGPTSDYNGYTGHWDYASGKEFVHPPVENGMGRQDVEGCCWWGRGSIQLRGTCAYGKLNYHLGKRAADEGRPSMFPDIDFCRNPQAICSSEGYPDLKWIAGMFRWTTEIQTYSQGEFNYMQGLMNFVDGGLQDWSFVHNVSGIVTQGCHEPPCIEGAEFDGADRKATFMKTLRLLGLKVKDGTTASKRRLGGST